MPVWRMQEPQQGAVARSPRCRWHPLPLGSASLQEWGVSGGGGEDAMADSLLAAPRRPGQLCHMLPPSSPPGHRLTRCAPPSGASSCTASHLHGWGVVGVETQCRGRGRELWARGAGHIDCKQASPGVHPGVEPGSAAPAVLKPVPTLGARPHSPHPAHPPMKGDVLLQTGGGDRGQRQASAVRRLVPAWRATGLKQAGPVLAARRREQCGGQCGGRAARRWRGGGTCLLGPERLRTFTTGEEGLVDICDPGFPHRVHRA